MNILDDLLAFIDNGGQRSYVKRRSKSGLHLLPERRSNIDRRKIVDRRRVQNQGRNNGPERRLILKK